jgi:tetratricopeptide (TPR) repeat protein
MRWLYFPMAFMMPALIAFIQKPLQEKKSLTIVILTAIIVYLGTYTLFLNKGLWHDEKVFFETEINKFNNTYYAYGLALTHLKNKNIQEADKYFRIAVTGYHSKRAKTLIDYAAFLNDTGRFNDALIYLKKANIWQIWPGEKEEWYRNMGTAYIHLGKSEKALPYLKLAAAYGPDEWLNWANLGAGFGTMGMYSESESALKKGLQIKPGSIRLRKNLAKTYVHMKEYDKAIRILSAISPDVLEEDVGLQMLMKKAQEGLAEQDF